jgi:hypothetical protein
MRDQVRQLLTDARCILSLDEKVIWPRNWFRRAKMSSRVSSFARSGLVALAALAMLPAAATAAPLGPTFDPAVASGSADKVIPVAQGEGRGGGPGYRFWPRVGRGNWNGGGWHGGGWRRGGCWDCGGWRRGWGGWGTGFALGLGLGVPLGYYGGRYYDEPVYRPRRAYRAPRYEYRDRRYNGGMQGNCDNQYLTGPAYSGCR